MDVKTKGETITRGNLTTTQTEIKDNNEYIHHARLNGREHVWIHELPYPKRFVSSRSKHDFLDVRLGAIYI